MNIKVMTDNKGDLQDVLAEVRLQGGGGMMGANAVRRIAAMIEQLKDIKAKKEVIAYSYTITGYALCCRDCGFLTDESVKDLGELITYAAERRCNKIDAEKKEKK